jgi:peptidoglycan/xylan/chitin deacetylase (PgdA/CDA1 family)
MGLYDQGRDFVGYGRTPPRFVWPNDARVAINITVAYEEGSEASHPAGDGYDEALTEFAYPKNPAFRDVNVESQFQYGSRVGIWRLARLFEEFDINCTLFGCAVAFELNPAVGEWVREAGHDVCAHGWRWEEIYRLDRETERDHLRRCVESIERTCGERPRGWFSRIQSPNTRELIVEEGGFAYDSDAFDDELPYFTEVTGQRHLVVPYTFVYNDSRMLPGQGYSDPSSLLDHLRRGFDYMWDEGATYPRMMSIGVHARWMGQAARAHALKEFIEYALEKGGVWFTRRIDVANWWIENHEEIV